MEGYFDAVFDSLLAAGMYPRAHLGKYVSHTSLERDYPRFHKFQDIRRKMDPQRMFVNDMLGNYIWKYLGQKLNIFTELCYELMIRGKL